MGAYLYAIKDHQTPTCTKARGAPSKKRCSLEGKAN
jgi:hypothetical protein